MFGYNYNSSMRRYSILLMELLSGVQVERERDGIKYYNKVPLTYASKERFVTKINSEFNNMRDGEIARGETILPRIGVHMVDMNYNGQMKTAMNVRNINKQCGKSFMVFNPVPYKFMYEVSIMTRYETDMLTIVEQILPYFQPNFVCKMTELYDKATPIDRDIQITFQSVAMEESVEGDRSERRRLEWTLIFELDGWLYANFADLKGEIRTTYLDFNGNMKQLPTDGSYFESADSQVVPVDVLKSDWDGSYIETMSHSIPIPVEPNPPEPRENNP